MTKIDLGTVAKILRESLDADVHYLQDLHLDDSKSVRENRHDAAMVTRDLLHLADNLDLAANLVRQQYWRAKGYENFTAVKSQ